MSFCLCNHIVRASIILLPCYTIALFYSLFLFILSKCMVLCLSRLSSQFPHSHHNQSPNQHADCCISPDRPFRATFSASSRSRTPLYFIASLLLFCCAQMVYVHPDTCDFTEIVNRD